MNGRILAERLLATTSVAVLALVVISPEADAACTAVNGGSFVNNGTLSCIAVTGNSVSVTNSASGVVGPAPTAIAVNSGVTVSGGLSTGRTETDNCEILAQVPEAGLLGAPYCHQVTDFLTDLKL